MPAVTDSRYLVKAGWDDVPHLDAKTKAELLASTSPHTRDARSKGEPSLSEGAIYPIPLEDVTVAPFKIPAFWPKGYGLDVGWKRTAAIWAAWDRDIDCIYLYAEHYRGLEKPPVHAAAIKARGVWIPGAIDPAARGRSQKDGEQLIQSYRSEGLLLNPAVNAVEAGLFECFSRLSTGRLKIFKTMQNFCAEYRLYRRDKNGKVVKQFDHAMDAGRYIVMTRGIMRIAPIPIRTGNHAADPHIGY